MRIFIVRQVLDIKFDSGNLACVDGEFHSPISQVATFQHVAFGMPLCISDELRYAFVQRGFTGEQPLRIFGIGVVRLDGPIAWVGVCDRGGEAVA